MTMSAIDVARMGAGRNEIVTVDLEHERVPGGEPRVARRRDLVDQLVGIGAGAAVRVDLADRSVGADEAEEAVDEIHATTCPLVAPG